MFIRPVQRIFVACDTSTEEGIVNIVKPLAGTGVGFKVGLEIMMSGLMVRAIEIIREYCPDSWIFLDPKIKDINNTVMKAALAAAGHGGIRFLNCHADMNARSLGAFAEACADSDVTSLAVTVLTDNTPKECERIYRGTPEETVARFSLAALSAGVRGIICSAQELRDLTARPEIMKFREQGLVFVTPGIRPLGDDANDQKRRATPGEAILLGSDFLVIGRPINEDEDPAEALRRIVLEVEQAYVQRLFAEREAILEGHFIYSSKHPETDEWMHGSHYIAKDIAYLRADELDWLCKLMARPLMSVQPDVVISAAVAGIPLSQNVTRHLREAGIDTLAVWADKDGKEFKLRGVYADALKDARVAIAEDIMTSGGTTNQIRALVEAHGGAVVEVVALCNRGGVTAEKVGLDDGHLHVLYEVDMQSYPESKVPESLWEVPISTKFGHGAAYLAAQEE